jgi:hypothetical protein
VLAMSKAMARRVPDQRPPGSGPPRDPLRAVQGDGVSYFWSAVPSIAAVGTGLTVKGAVGQRTKPLAR